MILRNSELISPPVWADLARTDHLARIKLDLFATSENLKTYGIVLKNGLKLLLYDEDLDDDWLIDDVIAVAIVSWAHPGLWVAEVQGGVFKHVSDLRQEEQAAYRRFRPQIGTPLS